MKNLLKTIILLILFNITTFEMYSQIKIIFIEDDEIVYEDIKKAIRAIPGQNSYWGENGTVNGVQKGSGVEMSKMVQQIQLATNKTVQSYFYNQTNQTFPKKDLSLDGYANEMKTYLETGNLQGTYGFYIIAQGFSGQIVKRYLQLYNPSLNGIKKVKGVVFIGTPHKGVDFNSKTESQRSAILNQIKSELNAVSPEGTWQLLVSFDATELAYNSGYAELAKYFTHVSFKHQEDKIANYTTRQNVPLTNLGNSTINSTLTQTTNTVNYFTTIGNQYKPLSFMFYGGDPAYKTGFGSYGSYLSYFSFAPSGDISPSYMDNLFVKIRGFYSDKAEYNRGKANYYAAWESICDMVEVTGSIFAILGSWSGVATWLAGMAASDVFRELKYAHLSLQSKYSQKVSSLNNLDAQYAEYSSFAKHSWHSYTIGDCYSIYNNNGKTDGGQYKNLPSISKAAYNPCGPNELYYSQTFTYETIDYKPNDGLVEVENAKLGLESTNWKIYPGYGNYDMGYTYLYWKNNIQSETSFDIIDHIKKWDLGLK